MPERRHIMIRKVCTVAASLTVLSLVLGGVSLVHAATGYSSNSGALQRLYITGNGTINVTLRSRPATAEDCGTNQYYFIPGTHPQRDAFLATLLMAWANGQNVAFRVRDPHVSGTNCEVSYLVLDR
jgi:hypothetical protein